MERSEEDLTSDLRAVAIYLVGPAEIGEMLGVEANTINVWKVRHPDFPTPVRKLKSGELWDSRDIAAWGRTTGRLPHPDTAH